MNKGTVPFPTDSKVVIAGKIHHAVADMLYRSLSIVYEPSPIVAGIPTVSLQHKVYDCQEVNEYIFCAKPDDIPIDCLSVLNVLRSENISDYVVCGFLVCVKSTQEIKL